MARTVLNEEVHNKKFLNNLVTTHQGLGWGKNLDGGKKKKQKTSKLTNLHVAVEINLLSCRNIRVREYR